MDTYKFVTFCIILDLVFLGAIFGGWGFIEANEEISDTSFIVDPTSSRRAQSMNENAKTFGMDDLFGTGDDNTQSELAGGAKTSTLKRVGQAVFGIQLKDESQVINEVPETSTPKQQYIIWFINMMCSLAVMIINIYAAILLYDKFINSKTD